MTLEVELMKQSGQKLSSLPGFPPLKKPQCAILIGSLDSGKMVSIQFGSGMGTLPPYSNVSIERCAIYGRVFFIPFGSQTEAESCAAYFVKMCPKISCTIIDADGEPVSTVEDLDTWRRLVESEMKSYRNRKRFWQFWK